jgi:hypothetical protein
MSLLDSFFLTLPAFNIILYKQNPEELRRELRGKDASFKKFDYVTPP